MNILSELDSTIDMYWARMGEAPSSLGVDRRDYLEILDAVGGLDRDGYCQYRGVLIEYYEDM